MDIIPVIDVRHGVAVHATGGRREEYRPLATPLADGSETVAVAQGLMTLFAFPALYVADLDAIEGRAENGEGLALLAAGVPGTELWIDAGDRVVEIAAKATRRGTVPVLGTESMHGEDDVATLSSLPSAGFILSLDFKNDRFLGPDRVLTDSSLWPERIIVMTLGRVGSGEGPDVAGVAEIVARAEGRRVYAAGGVRNVEDIDTLAKAGAAGALVATALHAEKITAGDLKKIAGRFR
jgi:HisA/HisF family protein